MYVRDAVDFRGVQAVSLRPRLSLHVEENDTRSTEIRNSFTARTRMDGLDLVLPSMHGVFLVRGPWFESDQRVQVFELIHISLSSQMSLA